MVAIKESEDAIREKYEVYIKELNRVSSTLSKKCAICTKSIIVTKEGVVTQCDKCVYKKIFQRHMSEVKELFKFEFEQ